MFKWFKKKKEPTVIEYLKSISPIGPVTLTFEEMIPGSGGPVVFRRTVNEYIDFRTAKDV